jgi:starch-binding outer membrane protein, SusD/RagB family
MIQNKKYPFNLLIIFVSLAILTSCKKVLDVKPFSQITDVSAFDTPERVEAAVNGVYDAAQSGFYAGGAVRGYPFGAANIQQGDMRGEDMYNHALFYQITYEATYNPTSANQDFMFQTLYALINKANLTIDGIKKAAGSGIVNATTASAYEAECRFLRAMAHQELLIHFARPYRDGNGSKEGIIYRDFAINSAATIEQAKTQTRTTVSSNYTKLIADLDFAEANLPATTTGSSKTYRATKAAAIALKMKAYLHTGNWASVITEGNKLTPASAPFTSPIGNWRLETLPSIPFTPAGWQGNEAIFSIRNAATDNAGANGGLASMLGTDANGGRALVGISPIIYNNINFRCDDLRRNMMIVVSGRYHTTKYTDPTTNSDPAPQIRYADVLLMLAEAEARNDAAINGRALALLNAVRNRAVTTAANQFTIASFATKIDLVKAILMERRIEFLAEGKRWADIHRNAVDLDFSIGGIPAKVGTGAASATAAPAMFPTCGSAATFTTPVTAFPYADYRFIWPIPLSERQSNPNYAQNPNY